MTDLIYRMAVVEQITNYNEETINELNDLVTKNEKRQKQINITGINSVPDSHTKKALNTYMR